MIDTDVAKVVAAIRDLPGPWVEWPGGWPDEVEAALLDAVLSIRAKYGSERTGVRAAIRRYRVAQGGAPLDSLSRLAAYEPQALEAVIRIAQRTAGVAKAEAVVNAARALREAGVEHASDVDPEKHKNAYTGVRGLGWVTWEYFTMLLGNPGIKADSWITRWVGQAVGDAHLSPAHARALLRRAADELRKDDPDLNLSRLDHVIWSHARSVSST